MTGSVPALLPRGQREDAAGLSPGGHAVPLTTGNSALCLDCSEWLGVSWGNTGDAVGPRWLVSRVLRGGADGAPSATVRGKETVGRLWSSSTPRLSLPLEPSLNGRVLNRSLSLRPETHPGGAVARVSEQIWKLPVKTHRRGEKVENPGKTGRLRNESTEGRRSRSMSWLTGVFLPCWLRIPRTIDPAHAFRAGTEAELAFPPGKEPGLGVQGQENKQKQPILEETHSSEKSPKNHLRSDQTGNPKVDTLFFLSFLLFFFFDGETDQFGKGKKKGK